ncbi:MAG: hypothetical protein WA049_04200 [Ferribacterium limneticum]
MKMPGDFIFVERNDIDIYHLNLRHMPVWAHQQGANCMKSPLGGIATVNREKRAKNENGAGGSAPLF